MFHRAKSDFSVAFFVLILVLPVSAFAQNPEEAYKREYGDLTAPENVTDIEQCKQIRSVNEAVVERYHEAFYKCKNGCNRCSMNWTRIPTGPCSGSSDHYGTPIPCMTLEKMWCTLRKQAELYNQRCEEIVRSRLEPPVEDSIPGSVSASFPAFEVLMKKASLTQLPEDQVQIDYATAIQALEGKEYGIALRRLESVMKALGRLPEILTLVAEASVAVGDAETASQAVKEALQNADHEFRETPQYKKIMETAAVAELMKERETQWKQFLDIADNYPWWKTGDQWAQFRIQSATSVLFSRCGMSHTKADDDDFDLWSCTFWKWTLDKSRTCKGKGEPTAVEEYLGKSVWYKGKFSRATRQKYELPKSTKDWIKKTVEEVNIPAPSNCFSNYINALNIKREPSENLVGPVVWPE